MPKISQLTLQSYFSAATTHPIYKDTVELYDALRIHADGEFPKKMIEERRPSESEDILDYRKKTYKAITKGPISKVISSLSKIRRSPDWNIEFEEGKVPAKIIETETLEYYLTKNLPGYGNITDWAFGILLKQNAIDTNAVCAVMPLEPITADKYCKPVPIIFNSDQVLIFDEAKQYALFKSRIKVNYLDPTGSNYMQGDRFFYVDDREVIIYEQRLKGYEVIFQQSHAIGKMPAWKLKGEVHKQYDNMVVNKSRLDAMVAYMDEAACEYSDYKGSKVQHLFPLFWYIQNKSCNDCQGAGKLPSENGEVQCTKCSGSGKIAFTPFAHLQLDAAQLGQQQVPTPPAGYITRDTAILELQDKSVDKNIYKALAAINMQFLDQTPLSVSGDAKNVDREELQNFVYNFAEDLIYSIDKFAYYANEWRNLFIVPSKEEREAMLPNIPVPQNFDLLPSDYLLKEIKDAKDSKANPFTIASLEKDLASKKFYGDPELSETIELFFTLDPLPNYTVDEKMSLISNQAITKQDFVISSYMAQFIRRAMIEHKNFTKLEYQKQMEILTGYADEKIKSNDQAAEMIESQKQKVLNEMAAAGAGPKGKPQPTV